MVRRIVVLLAAAFLACGAALAVDSNEDLELDLSGIRQMIKAKQFDKAVAALERILPSEHNADSYNLLGFSLRNLGKAHYDASLANYQKALKLDPKHRQAREYLGELYIKMGDMAKAREERATLQSLCPKGCEELEDLDKAIAAAPK
ncbi:MAG: hypothetical protein RLZ98_862 [Pseudomonadota bacterium]|jgi:tetratricopeptide (TPR) repeat protein